uniref:Uncharacterized protein n=1 Tax=Biomphalaria glabrata TaxID=6526 RepID=A0A2C9JD79_BIOGL
MLPQVSTFLTLLAILHLPKSCHSENVSSDPGSGDALQSLDDLRWQSFSSDGNSDVDKRVREFVGKRSEDQFYNENDAIEKRPRQFVGKRSEDKRVREFVGKRVREFVGKRDNGDIDTDKRVREFVGKRNSYGDEFDNADDVDRFLAEKRPRQFVGKRSGPYFYDEIISNEKRPRQFVGKRSSPYFYDEILNNEKRPRQFVGKRDNLEDIFLNEEKRPRQFVGKRYIADEDFLIDAEKRPRQFVGKRYSFALDNLVEKRPRQLVGKRNFDEVLTDAAQRNAITNYILHRLVEESPELMDGVLTEDGQLRTKRSVSDCEDDLKKSLTELFSKDDEDLRDRFSLDKRIREFVGKRSPSSCVDLVKRVREFVGKRAEKRPRQFQGKRSTDSQTKGSR